MLKNDISDKKIGLYIHIPFCSKICHYCDFAKSARFDKALVEAYFKKLHDLASDLESVLDFWGYPQFTSLYFGGGTPSLFPKEIKCLLETISPVLSKDAEITMEVNPEHANDQLFSLLSGTGINRLSQGIQTFDPKGLAFLTRTHSSYQAQKSLDLSLKHFSNVNVDIIFGWQGQLMSHFEMDLDTVLSSGVPHVSVYGLTYEGNTVFAKRNKRGVLPSMDEQLEADMYHKAREKLTGPFIHEEVSNYARPGFLANHNLLYWTDKPYLALGVGAHGYMKGDQVNDFGVRYMTPNRINDFLQAESKSMQPWQRFLENSNAEIEERNADALMAEVIWTGFRTRNGVSLTRLESIGQKAFCPSPSLKLGLESNFIRIDSTNQIYLDPSQWFLETSWALELCRSFP